MNALGEVVKVRVIRCVLEDMLATLEYDVLLAATNVHEPGRYSVTYDVRAHQKDFELLRDALPHGWSEKSHGTQLVMLLSRSKKMLDAFEITGWRRA